MSTANGTQTLINNNPRLNEARPPSNSSSSSAASTLTPSRSPQKPCKSQRPATSTSSASTATEKQRRLTYTPLAASTHSRGNEPLKSSIGSSWAYTEAYRDDVLFLKDDPFFQTYTTPQSEVLARQLRSSWPSHRPGDAVAQFLNWKMAAAGMAEASVGILLLEYKSLKILPLSMPPPRGEKCADKIFSRIAGRRCRRH